MRPVSAEEMAEIDRISQEEFGLSQSFLMENAGKSVAETILFDIPDIKTEKIAVFCGKGNNGGDGFVAARYLFKENPKELVIFTLYEEEMRDGSAKDNYLSAVREKIKIRSFREFLSLSKKNSGFTIGIDAVFGTGFKGELSEEYKSAFSIINSLGINIYAVDIPSGLDATDGSASDNCIKAFKTITFGLPKKGFYTNQGPHFTGEIAIKAIGFPQSLIMRYQ